MKDAGGKARVLESTKEISGRPEVMWEYERHWRKTKRT